MYTGISWIFVNVAPNFILSIPIVLSVSKGLVNFLQT